MSVPSPCNLFQGLSLALRSHDQFKAPFFWGGGGGIRKERERRGERGRSQFVIHLFFGFLTFCNSAWELVGLIGLDKVGWQSAGNGEIMRKLSPGALQTLRTSAGVRADIGLEQWEEGRQLVDRSTGYPCSLKEWWTQLEQLKLQSQEKLKTQFFFIFIFFYLHVCKGSN